MSTWAEKEMATIDLGDRRLDRRAPRVLEKLAEWPAKGLSSALGGWADTVAGYRLFNNEKTSVEKILAAHRDATLERVKQEKVVLAIQDTTELDYTKKTKMKGRGPLSSIDRQGFFAHNHLLATPERLPLGLLNTDIYARDEAEHGKAADRKTKPIEEKESYRWLEGYIDACALAALVPDVELISLMDREGDIYEIFTEWKRRVESGEAHAGFIIRSNQDRRLDGTPEPDANSHVSRKIRAAVESSPVLGTFFLAVSHKVNYKKVKGNRVKVTRSARTAEMELQATEVTLHPPYRKGIKLEPVTLRVVSVKEKAPPKHEDPIHWVLLTSTEVKNFDDAMKAVSRYSARWDIEVFHKVLKTGCRIEELQLQTDDRVKPAIAMYMIVAWRVMYLMVLGRECPELPCDSVFPEQEWKPFWIITHNGDRKAVETKPSLGEFIHEVGKAGGFLARKNDGAPGPQAIWQGLTLVRAYATAWQAYVGFGSAGREDSSGRTAIGMSQSGSANEPLRVGS